MRGKGKREMGKMGRSWMRKTEAKGGEGRGE